MKKFLICLLFLLLPISINASSIAIKLNCPLTVDRGEILECTVTLNQTGGVKEISGNFNYTGLTFNSFVKNGSYTTSTVDSSSFKFTNNNGFGESTLLGTLKVNVPSTATDNTTYTVAIKGIKGKDLEDKALTGTNQSRVVRVKSQNNNLSKLSVINADIDFNPEVYEYNVETESETVNISATVADKTAKVTGTGMKNLSYGLNKYTVVVTSEVGTTKTYTINITRKDSRNDDTTLSSLNVTNTNINFDSNTLVYNLETNSTGVSITATATNKKSKVTGTGSKNLSVGLNKFNIVVTSEAGTTRTYTLNITRVDNTKESKIHLTSLKIAEIPFTFASNISSYNLKTNLNEINISAIASDSSATITGTGLKKINSGQNLFEIKVTKGTDSKTYKLYIVKSNTESTTTPDSNNSGSTNNSGTTNQNDSGSNNSGNTNQNNSGSTNQSNENSGSSNQVDIPKLTELYVPGATIDFEPNKYEYTVDTYLDTANVVAKSDDSDVTVSCPNGQKLNIGNNLCEVIVKDNNGKTTTYKVNINRKQSNNQNNTNNSEEGSNAEITNIIIKDHEFKFEKGTYNYDLTTNYKKLDITVLTKEMTTAIIIKGNNNLNDNSIITITSIALDGSTETYSIKISNEQEIVSDEVVKTNTLDLTQMIILGIEFLIIFILLIKIIFRKNK